MAHQISVHNAVAEVVSGRGMTPWHKLGTVVQGLMTSAEALKAAHLDWEVVSLPVFVNGQQLPFPTEENSDGYQAICRGDAADSESGCLGIVKGRYEPIQNAEAFNFFDHLIGQGKAVYDTAGALRGGRQVWLLAKVDGEIGICGDAHRQYALMLTSHDGSYAMQVTWVLERVVCANTLSIALCGAQNTCKVRHTASWKDKEAEAARVLGLGEHYFKTVQESLAKLHSQLLTPEQMAQFTELLLPAKVEDGKPVPTRTANIRAEIDRLFDRGDGNKGQSRWDALQAVTDYADHFSTLRGENSTRLESATFGAAAQLKQRAFDLLTGEELTAQLIAAKPHVSVADGLNEFSRLMGS